MNLRQVTLLQSGKRGTKREWSIRRILLPLLVCMLAMVAGQSRAQDVTSEDVRQWRQAAEQGEAWAQHNLGLCYNDGLGGLTQNYYEAVKWYRKAAEQGFALAQNNLGLCYEFGNGVAQNYYEAVKWFRKAAEQGLAESQYCLGNLYGDGNGVTQDYYEAVKWLRKAAEQGYSMAQHNLGNHYYQGNGVTQDYYEAAKWFRKAAEQGHEEAQFGLGLCYYFGYGVAQDYAEAVKLWRKIAEQGHEVAQNNLGLCYENGHGVAQNYYEAVKWYRKAAEQGYSMAQYNMGDCYYQGNGMTQDYYEAAKWYRKAAEQGYASAQYRLGNCYYLGEGVTKNHTEAAKWYRKAAEQGNEWAEIMLTALSKITTTEADDEAFDDAATSTATVIDAGSTASTSTAQGKSTNTNTAISTSRVGTINGHEYVDLGLSVLWATCNVGASSPSGYGNYYAWGETSTKSSYTSDNYKYDLSWVGAKDIGENISGTEYDAARANWGAAWRMPTLDELKELEEKCTWTWTSQDGHYGYRVTGPNGKSIFLPAAGYYDGAGLHRGSEGLYWSSVVDYYWDYPVYDVWEEGEMEKYCDFAHILRISSSGCTRDTKVRERGLSIRPVIDAGSTASTSSTTTVVTVSPKGYADFFPIYGVLPGKTTVSDVKALGYIAKSDGDDYKAYIQTLTFWDFDGNGVFKDIYMVNDDAMPDKWRELGLDWKLSYDEWLALFQRMDFSIEHTKAPETTEYSGRNTLSAAFVATSPDQTFTMDLTFNYGNGHGEGYSTRSKRSLYSISVKLQNKPSVFPVNDARALSVASVPAVRRYFSDFFPVYGVTIGRSTIADVKALDYAVKGEECAYVEGLTFWNHNGDQIFEDLYVTNGDPMPEKWQRLGLDWRLSYDEWLALFQKMGFAIEHTRSPGTEYNALSAEFVATAPDGSFTMRMNFNYGNQNGEGRRTSSRNSLYSISIDKK